MSELHDDEKSCDSPLNIRFCKTWPSIAAMMNIDFIQCQSLLQQNKARLDGPEADTDMNDGVGRMEATVIDFHMAEPFVFRALLTETHKDIDAVLHMLEPIERAAKQQCECGRSDSWSRKIIRKLRSASLSGGSVPAATPPPAPCFDCIIVAHCALWRACLLIRRSSYVTGGIALRTAAKLYQQLALDLDRWTSHESIPSCDDANNRNLDVSARERDIDFGLGALQFFVSLVPPAFNSVVRALGFEGDRAGGRELLRRCARSNASRAPLALLLLVWIESVFYEDHNEAERLFTSAELHLPTGAFFFYLHGYLARKQGHLDKAQDLFLRAERASHQLPPLEQACRYERGWCCLLDERFDDAIKLFDQFLGEYAYPSFRAYAAYQLALAHELSDPSPSASSKLAAAEAMRRVAPVARPHFSFDQFAKRKAAEYLSNGGLEDGERQIVRISLALEAHRVDRARENLNVLDASRISGNSSVSDALYWYNRARVERAEKRYTDALKSCERVESAPSKRSPDYFVWPHVLCERGELTLELYGDKECKQAHQLFQAASNCKNYDWDKVLARRLALNLDRSSP